MAKCLRCDVEFQVSRKWQHFCSVKCRNLWHYAIIKEKRLREKLNNLPSQSTAA